ncbi:MAG: PucR family transcriptional regulator, partial [Actinomycetota bacterium]
MEVTLQQLLDALAERVGRPAILEDRSMRLLAYSRHDERLDDVREDSILRRHASPEVKRWLSSLGVPESRRPVRVPGNPELHMLPRVCIPVLHKDRLFGYLWFVDATGSMTTADLDVCTGKAAELGEQLYRESVASLLSTKRISDALYSLLNDSALATEAAGSLVDAGYLTADDGVAVAILQGVPSTRTGVVDLEEPLSRAMAELRRALPWGHALDLVRRDHAILLVACAGDDDPRLAERVDIARHLGQAALAASGATLPLVVGVGSHQAAVHHAGQSCREARMSVEAARVLPGIGEIVYWTRLGVHQLVVKLAAMGEDMPVVHPGLWHLLGDRSAQPLLETLETYLDTAGNAQLTAELLNLHRTSLYYRLQRLERLAQTDLKDGVERLALHLSLKVARMTGDYLPRRENEPRADREVPAAPFAPSGAAPPPV